jgi:hypothetical protein
MLPKVPLLLVVEVYFCSSISICTLQMVIYSSAIYCLLSVFTFHIFSTQFVWCCYILQCVSYILCVIYVLSIDADLLHLVEFLNSIKTATLTDSKKCCSYDIATQPWSDLRIIS